MQGAVTAALWALAAVLVLPALSDLCSVVRCAFGGGLSPDVPLDPGSGTRMVVVVLAHDEEGVLGTTLACLREAVERSPVPVDVVVVADNCSDGTAEVARQHGYQVMERREPDRAGKQHAIGWVLPHLALDEVDVVVLLDADVEPEAGVLKAIADRAPWYGRAGQVRQVVSPRSSRTRLGRLSRVVVDGRYEAAYRLKARCRLNVPLTGVCVVLGPDVARSTPWGSLGPAEDLELYALLSAHGHRVEYVSAAAVRFHVEATLGGSATQRARWSGGRSRAALKRTGSVLRGRMGPWQTMDTVAELWALGPVEHVVVAAVGSVAAILTGHSVLAVVLPVTLIRHAIYAMAGFRLQEDKREVAMALAFLPVYLVWRTAIMLVSIPVAITGRWRKTPRSH